MVFGIVIFAQENACIICPNGITAPEGDDHIPYAEYGDNRTCAALTFESGTGDCGCRGPDELVCCKTQPENPCIICPDGITNDEGDDHYPATWGASCKYISDWAKQFETGSDSCQLYGAVVPECCPPSTVSPTTPFMTRILVLHLWFLSLRGLLLIPGLLR